MLKKADLSAIRNTSFYILLAIVLITSAQFIFLNRWEDFKFVNRLILMTIILILSVISCAFLLYIMGKISHHIKFFLIISILILVYALGQSYHLSSLILILAFGLFLNNADSINYAWFKTIFIYENLSKDLTQLHQLSAETAFIIRTFFFVIFGFTMNIYELNDFYLIINGLLILISIYVIRFTYLIIFKKEHILPEGFVSPRGLISILLYYNLPENMKLAEISTAF